MEILKTAIGSTSQDKYNILAECLDKKGYKFSIIKCDVDSGVSDQPTTEKETITGAKNRAKNAFKDVHKDNILFAIGLEGGLKKIDGIYNLICCASIFYGDHWIYNLSSPLQLPPEVSKDIDNGYEFGKRIREYYKICSYQEKETYQVEELISRKVSFSEVINKCLESPAIIKAIVK